MDSGPRKNFKSQSAMEFLMTYGWAILAVAVVLGAIFQLKLFSPSLPTSCLSAEPYACRNPSLNANGILTAQVGELGSTITLTGLNCSSISGVPNRFTAPGSVTLISGVIANLTFSCPLSSNTVGASFSGKLWIMYDTATQSGLLAQVGTVTATATSTGSTSSVSATPFNPITLTVVGTGGTVTPSSGSYTEP